MKTLKKVQVESELVDVIPEMEEMEYGVIYISELYNTSSHKCLCGCGQLTVMPISSKEWKYSISDSGKLSMSPSVGNYQFPCKSHYIIGNGIANFV